MTGLPTGTVTFLFTDIEGSTRLLERLKDAYADVLVECRRLIRSAVQERGGQEVDTEGDAVFVAFPSAREGFMAAVTAQQRILCHPWPDGAAVRVRMGLHTGEARIAEGGYVGMDIHRAARICAAAHGGQILVSDVTQGLVRTDLPDGVSLRDLGEHRLKDLAHPLRLFQALAPDVPRDFPPLRSLDAHAHNLPMQLTSFIGREREIAEVKALLSKARLVTLTGSGGAGKTRLALQVAADVVEGYRDGVWLAEFAPISDPALVPKTVASALNVPEQPGREIIETLVDALRPKALLLVLDNCEHLLAACAALVGALLRAAPDLRIIATSREPLGVPGEAIRRVPSLALPAPRDQLSPEQVRRYDSVRLFVERAIMIQPEFAVTQRNAAAVGQVVTRLDGIPLAIELAAARLNVLTVEQIAARLDDRFRLLTGGSRTSLPRQQTLRAAMDWSYELLSPKERTMLGALAVFVGGWALEAAESICVGKAIKRHEILDLLTQLTDKSLVLAEARRDEARYRLPETVRQYALERSLESRTTADLRRRHRDWYLALAERANTMFGGPDETVCYRRFEVEHDNLRTALGWSLEQHGSADAALRLAAALGSFWHSHSHYAEGRQWLARALAQSSGIVSSARGRALDYAAVFAWRQRDDERAAALSEESVAVLQELGETPRLADAYRHRGLVPLRQSDFAAATVCFEKSLALARECGQKWLIAHALSMLAIVARYQGHHAKAWALSEEYVILSREVGGKRAIAHATRLAGDVARSQAELSRAVRLYKESLALYSEAEDKWIAEECLEGLAAVAAALEDYRRAVHLFASAETVRDALGLTLPSVDQDIHNEHLIAARAALGITAFTAVWAEGRAMTLEQAIECALEIREGDAAVTHAPKLEK
jgi:predicted ATPase/class 3 adenylate cyclase